MSRTRPARAANSALSSSGRPYSLTSIAPPTLKRSVISELISAFRSMLSRCTPARRRPRYLAGTRNSGIAASEARVSCHDRANIALSTAATLTALATSDCSTEVMAFCAPTTSVLSLLISDPVWVRVKNASGMRCTCVNAWVRSR